MRKAIKSTLTLAAAGVAAMAGVAATPSFSSAWGDNMGGRRNYTLDQINHGVLGNKVVLNSISNSTIGNEFNYVGARVNNGIGAGIYNEWHSNDIDIVDGKEYIIRLYVHNNNPNGRDAVSHNTRVSFDIPTASGTTLQVNGFIYSDNATPSKYWDYINFHSDKAFHLEYVYGSALLENNGVGKNGGVKLSDEIVTAHASKNGVQIGYDKLDGEVPGCYSYANYVTIRVKAVVDKQEANYSIHNTVSLDGTDKWGESVEAKVGDIVEFRIHYKNLSNPAAIQENVRIHDILPPSLRYVPGTITIINALYPKGASTTGTGLFDSAIGIGNYGQNANGYVQFKAQVIGDNLQCGSNTLVNWAQGGVGQKTIQDYASVVVHKTCDITDEHNVRVDYIYEDTGKTAAPSYTGVYKTGDQFFVDSPEIKGYTPNIATVRGSMANKDLVYTVKYSRSEFNLRVNYVYKDTGATAAPSVTRTYKTGDQFTIASPIVQGYTPSIAIVQGTIAHDDLEYTVEYSRDAEQHRVIIQYISAEDGTDLAPIFDIMYTEGTEFSVNSPLIEGWTADLETVSGLVEREDIYRVVTYTRNPVEDPTDPDDKFPNDQPGVSEFPTTGPLAVTGSIVGLGSIVTSAGYYVASRRALRK